MTKIHEPVHMMLQELIKQKADIKEMSSRSCPSCGITFREFRAQGLLGCPDDYEAFKDLLSPLLERAHGEGPQHVGKVPSYAAPAVKDRARLIKLRRDLEAALQVEDYEAAATLRDQIDRLGHRTEHHES